jgi:hypothetical protein
VENFHFALALVELLTECFKLGVSVHVASYKFIPFNVENILSACAEFGFVVEIDIAFANSDFRSVSYLMSKYSTTTFTSSSLCFL